MDISNIVNPCIKLIPCDDNRPLLIKGLDIYKGKLHRFASILKRILLEKTFDIRRPQQDKCKLKKKNSQVKKTISIQKKDPPCKRAFQTNSF